MRSWSPIVTLVIASVCLGACVSSPAPPSEGPLAVPSAPSPAPSADVTANPSETGSPTVDPIRSATPPAPITSFAGKVVATLATDGIRVRSEPRISDDSHKEEPLLPPGTELYVLDGPVSASGYAWYEVVPLTTGKLPHGWIASADRDGMPWIAPGDFSCPPVPTNLRALAALPPGVGLVCFSRVPITVQARLISCNCDADGSWYTPSWFFLGSGGPALLVERDVTAAPPDFADWFVLNLDPAGKHPGKLPLGQMVEVTGIFDHPAASTCTKTEMDGDPAPSQGCRLEFAVTQLRVVGP